MRRRKGFSIVELAIVLTIMGVIAAIAIPAYRDAQARSKRAEVPANVEGIKVAQSAHHQGAETYVACDRAPRTVPDKTAVDWVPTDGFTEIGWSPTGAVRGVYEVEYTDGDEDFLVRGYSDTDGDGNQAEYTATLTQAATIAAGDEAAY